MKWETAEKCEVSEPKEPSRRFKLVPFDQITFSSDPAYLVKGILPREGLAVIWGPPKCGKSFWTYDLLMHAALGRAYRGRKVQQGVVVYIACEGERGLGARTEAWRRECLGDHSEPVPFYLLTTRLKLSSDADELIAEIRDQVSEQIASIAVDTLNRSIEGSESSDQDMTAFINAADQIRESFSCLVAVIHHCGIEGSRPRGHTSLSGAIDCQIAVRRDGDVFTATVELMKDGREGDVIASAFEVVEIGTDTDGDIISSCVVREADPPVQPTKGISGQSRTALELLKRALNDAGEIPPANHHLPTGAKCVSLSLWRSYCYSGRLTDSDSEDAKRKAFQRAFNRLHGTAVGAWGDWVWTIKPETE